MHPAPGRPRATQLEPFLTRWGHVAEGLFPLMTREGAAHTGSPLIPHEAHGPRLLISFEWEQEPVPRCGRWTEAHRWQPQHPELVGPLSPRARSPWSQVGTAWLWLQWGLTA